jgi:hypothetical protein
MKDRGTAHLSGSCGFADQICAKRGSNMEPVFLTEVGEEEDLDSQRADTEAAHAGVACRMGRVA